MPCEVKLQNVYNQTYLSFIFFLPKLLWNNGEMSSIPEAQPTIVQMFVQRLGLPLAPCFSHSLRLAQVLEDIWNCRRMNDIFFQQLGTSDVLRASVACLRAAAEARDAKRPWKQGRLARGKQETTLRHKFFLFAKMKAARESRNQSPILAA